MSGSTDPGSIPAAPLNYGGGTESSAPIGDELDNAAEKIAQKGGVLGGLGMGDGSSAVAIAGAPSSTSTENDISAPRPTTSTGLTADHPTTTTSITPATPSSHLTHPNNPLPAAYSSAGPYTPGSTWQESGGRGWVESGGNTPGVLGTGVNTPGWGSSVASTPGYEFPGGWVESGRATAAQAQAAVTHAQSTLSENLSHALSNVTSTLESTFHRFTAASHPPPSTTTTNTNASQPATTDSLLNTVRGSLAGLTLSSVTGVGELKDEPDAEGNVHKPVPVSIPDEGPYQVGGGPYEHGQGKETTPTATTQAPTGAGAVESSTQAQAPAASSSGATIIPYSPGMSLAPVALEHCPGAWASPPSPSSTASLLAPHEPMTSNTLADSLEEKPPPVPVKPIPMAPPRTHGISSEPSERTKEILASHSVDYATEDVLASQPKKSTSGQPIVEPMSAGIEDDLRQGSQMPAPPTRPGEQETEKEMGTTGYDERERRKNEETLKRMAAPAFGGAALGALMEKKREEKEEESAPPVQRTAVEPATTTTTGDLGAVPGSTTEPPTDSILGTQPKSTPAGQSIIAPMSTGDDLNNSTPAAIDDNQDFTTGELAAGGGGLLGSKRAREDERDERERKRAPSYGGYREAPAAVGRAAFLSGSSDPSQPGDTGLSTGASVPPTESLIGTKPKSTPAAPNAATNEVKSSAYPPPPPGGGLGFLGAVKGGQRTYPENAESHDVQNPAQIKVGRDEELAAGLLGAGALGAAAMEEEGERRKPEGFSADSQARTDGPETGTMGTGAAVTSPSKGVGMPRDVTTGHSPAALGALNREPQTNPATDILGPEPKKAYAEKPSGPNRMQELAAAAAGGGATGAAMERGEDRSADTSGALGPGKPGDIKTEPSPATLRALNNETQETSTTDVLGAPPKGTATQPQIAPSKPTIPEDEAERNRRLAEAAGLGAVGGTGAGAIMDSEERNKAPGGAPDLGGSESTPGHISTRPSPATLAASRQDPGTASTENLLGTPPKKAAGPIVQPKSVTPIADTAKTQPRNTTRREEALGGAAAVGAGVGGATEAERYRDSVKSGSGISSQPSADTTAALNNEPQSTAATAPLGTEPKTRDASNIVDSTERRRKIEEATALAAGGAGVSHIITERERQRKGTTKPESADQPSSATRAAPPLTHGGPKTSTASTADSTSREQRIREAAALAAGGVAGAGVMTEADRLQQRPTDQGTNVPDASGPDYHPASRNPAQHYPETQTAATFVHPSAQGRDVPQGSSLASSAVQPNDAANQSGTRGVAVIPGSGPATRGQPQDKERAPGGESTGRRAAEDDGHKGRHEAEGAVAGGAAGLAALGAERQHHNQQQQQQQQQYEAPKFQRLPTSEYENDYQPAGAATIYNRPSTLNPNEEQLEMEREKRIAETSALSTSAGTAAYGSSPATRAAVGDPMSPSHAQTDKARQSEVGEASLLTGAAAGVAGLGAVSGMQQEDAGHRAPVAARNYGAGPVDGGKETAVPGTGGSTYGMGQHLHRETDREKELQSDETHVPSQERGVRFGDDNRETALVGRPSAERSHPYGPDAEERRQREGAAAVAGLAGGAGTRSLGRYHENTEAAQAEPTYAPAEENQGRRPQEKPVDDGRRRGKEAAAVGTASGGAWALGRFHPDDEQPAAVDTAQGYESLDEGRDKRRDKAAKSEPSSPKHKHSVLHKSSVKRPQEQEEKKRRGSMDEGRRVSMDEGERSPHQHRKLHKVPPGAHTRGRKSIDEQVAAATAGWAVTREPRYGYREEEPASPTSGQQTATGGPSAYGQRGMRAEASEPSSPSPGQGYAAGSPASRQTTEGSSRTANESSPNTTSPNRQKGGLFSRLKGETKIVSGKLAHDAGKVDEGRALKDGLTPPKA